MAPRGNKRAAAAKAADKAPKKAKLTPEEEQLERVVVAIQGAEQLTPTCRDLLVTAAQGSLSILKDSRHACQDKVIAMIGEALNEQRAAKDADVASEAEKVKAAEESLATLKAASEAAEAVQATKSEAVKAAEAQVSETQAAVAEASSALKATEAASQQSIQTQSTKEAESAAFDAAVKEHFAVLLNGTWEEEAQAQQQMETLGPFIAQLQLDESLRTALPAACVKMPSTRGSFDCLVLEQASKAFSDKAAELRAAAAACGPAAAEATAAVAAAQAALESAQATAASRTAALAEAMSEQSQSVDASKAAAQEVKSFEAELKRISKGHSLAMAELELVAGPLADFESLRDRTAKVAEAAAEVAAEAPVAEAGA